MEHRNYPYSPPFLLPKAAGNWLLKPRRATRRMRLWALMFLLLTPDKVESRGPQINTYNLGEARATELREEGEGINRVVCVCLILAPPLSKEPPCKGACVRIDDG